MKKDSQAKDNVHEFWMKRAELGKNAGSNDVIAKEIEINAISSYVRDGMRILDFGCGSGVTALEIAKKFDVDILGIDYAAAMILEADRLAASVRTKGKTRFAEGDVTILATLGKKFDLVYTERALINLQSWELQQEAITTLTKLLVPGGAYIMCENSSEGLDSINALRCDADLQPISPPWHNRYIRDDEIDSLDIPGVSLEDVNHYSSTYYFLSRVVNAWLAEQEGAAPRYDAPVNQLALKLPPFGKLGQGRIWVWRKYSEGD